MEEMTVRELLEEIAKGAGAFNRDPLTHAHNCIEDMKELAKQALLVLDAKEEEDEPEK